MKLTNTIDPEVELPKVEKMLYSLAWKTSNAYPVSFEEAKAEAYFAFMKACEQFDPKRGAKFSSWCYFWTWTHLKTFVTKRTVDPLCFVELDDDLTGEAPPERSEFMESLADLSEDAKEIISLLLETPGEILELGAPTPKRILKRVKDYLVERKGKKWLHVEVAVEEIICKLQGT